MYLIEIPPQKQINYSTCNEILRNHKEYSYVKKTAEKMPNISKSK
jgi:hypothetical protein